MKLFHGMTGIGRTLALVGALSFASSRSEATSLNLTSGPPDFLASPVTNVNYDSTTGSFQVTGYVTNYTNYPGASTNLVDVGPYTLEAWITSAGVLTNGTLTIMGDIGSGVETLLTGTLNTGPDGTAFGSTNLVGNSIFEFLFTVAAVGNSSVISDFGGDGATNRGVILTVKYEGGDTQFDGTWGSNFGSTSSESVADNFVQIPEPSSFFALLLAGGLCVMTLRSRHRRV